MASELNENGLPNELSLGRVLNDLYMAPHEIAALIGSWHAQTRGTPAESQALADHAAAVVDATTYNHDLANQPTPSEPKKFVPEKHEFTFFGNPHETATPPTPMEPTVHDAPSQNLTVVPSSAPETAPIVAPHDAESPVN